MVHKSLSTASAVGRYTMTCHAVTMRYGTLQRRLQIVNCPLVALGPARLIITCLIDWM